ncbi:hypothetical protein MKS88_003177 [Plasmodium brasilianum]|uniref:Uncharacterized protein n=2 Tax=Plasmodium (Plasmodium) TaxID=418103 RepID=A0A1D3RIA0_PLAMA|nr:conserved Plasmodium protein, unknown function [Plasmodium malariae]KAI4837762.1 hypothetical protein MKS88_003177 [Plasmodium brasilianum]SCN44747.1 conserved Plasmodium protein, unknown function [Plasmodium malariae]
MLRVNVNNKSTVSPGKSGDYSSDNNHDVVENTHNNDIPDDNILSANNNNYNIHKNNVNSAIEIKDNSISSSGDNNDISTLHITVSDNSTNVSLSKNNSNDDDNYVEYEKYNLNKKSSSDNFLSHKSDHSVSIHAQENEETYKERTKYNKKKSSFFHEKSPEFNNNYPSYFNTLNDNTVNNPNRNYMTVPRKNKFDSDVHLHNMDKLDGANRVNEINSANCDISSNEHNDDKRNISNCGSDDYSSQRVDNSGQPNKDLQMENEIKSCKLSQNCENSPLDKNQKKTEQMDRSGEKRLSEDIETYNTHLCNNGRNDTHRYNYITQDIHQDFHVNRERAMSHAKIFDYVEYNNGPDNIICRQKDKRKNTFIPKYKNLSAKEIHYNSLSGNDNITILAANKIKLDLNKLSESNQDALPDVYPFHLSKDLKSEKNEDKLVHLEKLYPTNYNYINNYSKNNCDITIQQRRYNMNSSHIFDYDEYEKKEENNEKNNPINIESYMDKQNIDTEKEEKRKLNPFYTDLFGRKTPDINQNVQCEKIMPTTMNCNWMYCPVDGKKYTAQMYKSAEYLEYNRKENFHRKSYFDKDGYDKKQRLLEAMQKGTRASLQVHLQSNLQDDKTYNLEYYNNVEATYLSLQNIKESLSDDEIKQVIKKSGAYIVTYEPEYDLFSNKRKSNAKLVIRHANGKETLNLLLSLLSQLDIKAQVM